MRLFLLALPALAALAQPAAFGRAERGVPVGRYAWEAGKNQITSEGLAPPARVDPKARKAEAALRANADGSVWSDSLQIAGRTHGLRFEPLS